MNSNEHEFKAFHDAPNDAPNDAPWKHSISLSSFAFIRGSKNKSVSGNYLERFVIISVCCFILFIFLPFLAAQTTDTVADAGYQHFSGSVFSVKSNLVSVPAAVTNASGFQGIAGLQIEDFRLSEDGRSVEISRLVDSSGLNIALLFDVSGSVYHNFEFQQKAAIDFLEKIWKEGDTVTIISFAERLEVLQKSGGNLQEATHALRQLRPLGRTTSFFDAVILATQLIEQSASAETRQMMIVLSDGVDNTSVADHAMVLAEMQRRYTVFYAINPRGADVVRLNKTSFIGQENLTMFANATGGTVFVSDYTSELRSIFGKIESELRAQYLLLYYSLVQQMDGKFHTIDVSIPGRPELNVRARPGFLAAPR